MDDTRLACVKCDRALTPDLVNMRCPECNEPLEVRFPLTVPRDWFRRSRQGSCWERYAPFYPYWRMPIAVSLGEGGTPLLKTRRIQTEVGVGQLYMKNETTNPTWTFKDRGSVGSIQNAIQLGYTRIGALSSGNAGASVAAFGTNAGLKSLILLKHNVPREKINALSIYGAEAIQVIGAYETVFHQALELGRSRGIYFSVSDEPFRVEGYKSLAFEVFEQLGRKLPDVLAVPLGSGGFCRGILKGFEELRSAGITDRLPLFVATQSRGCSPTVDAFVEGRETITYFQNAQTLDHVLENPLPQSGNEILRKFRKHGFILNKVDNSEILAAQRAYGKEGVFAQPASATALAGLTQAAARKMIPADCLAVAVVTGSGLKYPPVLQQHGFIPVRVEIEHLVREISTRL